MSAARWGRLVDTLLAAGVESPRLTEKSYAQQVHGRVQHGVSRSIRIRHPAGGFVVVADRWWHKNPDKWVGWEVSREDSKGFVLYAARWSKKRSEVAASVTEMLGVAR